MKKHKNKSINVVFVKEVHFVNHKFVSIVDMREDHSFFVDEELLRIEVDKMTKYLLDNELIDFNECQ